ncbi:Transketolase [Planctomycetes bacterium Pla163]|uniref:Transketolase n=1 Tax=Rohdeia mirabilis TaxID=2528008 RepID=A0A518CUY7_9BACT|nr:Transketolase [Planctomycetes bacterium Pla163]
MQTQARPTFDALAPHFDHWKKVGDMMDQCIDLMLNLRQSGHPGGSRSKVPMLVASTLGAGMRFDIRNPQAAFGDRFVLVAGHCNPAIYALLAVYNEAMRRRFEKTGDARFQLHNQDEWGLYPEDLLTLRHNGGLPGHAEMEGKTLFFKFNTGPSGHGAPAALGEAMALKHAGAGDVKVFAMEGEGGHTAGAHHEVKNSAFGLGLDNLVYLMDWNDHGIDSFANSEVMHGGPKEWFEPYGWRVAGAEDGEDYAQLTRALLEIVHADDTGGRPGCVWFKVRKGRGYGVFDAASHGKAHARNGEMFWKCREEFASRYGLAFDGHGDTQDPGEGPCREQTRGWLETVFELFDKDEALLEYLTDTLVEQGEAVPTRPDSFNLTSEANLATDRSWLDVSTLPKELFVAPGAKAANKDGFAKFGAWVNGVAKQRMGRPLVLACSADLADSTAISGFAKAWGDEPGFGWYERNSNVGGALLPQQITEFTNAGLVAGIATVNMAADPENDFVGFWGACSTYGSFSYLKYGLMRLFSQLAQDCPLKVGKTIWVVGHSGPETAEDSRTHFGIFAPAVTQLFPRGHVINLHPFEHNEVAPMLAAALQADAPIVALHLTRPTVSIPDRRALGIPSHLDAAKGAYVLRDHDPNRPKQGTVFVQGTSTTESIYEILPRLADASAPNIKLIAAVSPELYALQSQAYRDSVCDHEDWLDSTVITNGARKLMGDWLAHSVAYDYAMGSDWDDRWRTGGNVAELKVEAKIDAESLWEGLLRFAGDRKKRLAQLTHPDAK